MERPELTAGPGVPAARAQDDPSKARSIDSRLTDIFRIVCFLATSVYCARVAGPRRSTRRAGGILALSRPRSVRACVYAARMSRPSSPRQPLLFHESNTSFDTLTGSASCSERDDIDITPPSRGSCRRAPRGTRGRARSPRPFRRPGHDGYADLAGFFSQWTLLVWDSSSPRDFRRTSRGKTGRAMSFRNRSYRTGDGIVIPR